MNPLFLLFLHYVFPYPYESFHIIATMIGFGCWTANQFDFEKYPRFFSSEVFL